MRDFDVVIVGARCAGSPLAVLLARQGLDVCVLDRDGFPSDTPSTHGIQPVGVQILERLGVLGRLREVAPPVEDGFLAFDEHRASLDYAAAIVGAPMYNVRRLVLDAILVDAARESGAELRTRQTVTGLLTAGGRVCGVETTAGAVRAPLVVGADGARSTVARLVGAEEYFRTAARRLFLWSYFEGIAESAQRLWLGSIGGDGFLASPTDSGLFLAAFVAPVERREELRANRTRAFEEGVARWRELGRALSGGRRVAPVSLMSNWHGFFRRATGPGWALIGDAGHFKDPTPGQGIADALRQAEALAPAIAAALTGRRPDDAPLLDWWRWRDEDAWEMYWFAQDIGDTQRAPNLLAAVNSRMASDQHLIEQFLRVLNHDVPPSKVFSASLSLSLLARALREGSGRRRRLLAEAGGLAREELRRSRLRRRGPHRPRDRRRAANRFPSSYK